MDSENNIFEKLGGRKFLLSVLVIAAIVAMAVAAPGSLTTEVIIGLLGVIAAYSGSNAVLTGLAMRQPANGGNVADIQTTNAAQVMESIVPENNTAELETKVMELKSRMSQNEKTISEIIEVLKQIMNKKA